LSEIVRSHAMQYALAVAGREYLSEPLSELLAASGEVEVVGRLVGNQGAPLSTETLRQIAIDYDNDRRVQEPLIRRPALPYELVDQLVTVIGKRLEWDLICQRRMSADEAQRLVAAKQMLQILAREQSERSLERELRQRMAAGELDADAVLGFPSRRRDQPVRGCAHAARQLEGTDPSPRANLRHRRVGPRYALHSRRVCHTLLRRPAHGA
jgi:Uncharacterised protein conserved in bacteria (DUF2336)